MNAPTDSLPSITISPPSASEQEEIDNVSQTIFTAPTKVDQMSSYDSSSDDGPEDGPLPSSARSIPPFRPAQSKTNPSSVMVVQQCNNSNGQLEVLREHIWDRDKTHKLHLDLHLRRHQYHPPQQQQQQPPAHYYEEEPLGVFNYNGERDKMHKLHLKLHLPRHSSLSSSERHLELSRTDGIDAPIVFMTTVPALKYHEYLECITYARLTQKEYEHRILTRENTSDANITILCPGYGDSMAKTIEIDRELMMKAPEMVPILLSDHYLQGCRMLFQFPKDPHVCFSFVKRYLEDRGPDGFTKAVLKGWMDVHYSSTLNRCIVYVRLYRLACKLGLHALMHMAFEAMVDDDHAITAPYCVELAKLIFQRSLAYDDDGLIQEWCFEHIRDNFILLNQDEDWLNLLPYLAGIIQTRWKNLVEFPTECGYRARRCIYLCESSNSNERTSPRR